MREDAAAQENLLIDFSAMEAAKIMGIILIENKSGLSLKVYK